MITHLNIYCNVVLFSFYLVEIMSRHVKIGIYFGYLKTQRKTKVYTIHGVLVIFMRVLEIMSSK